MTRVTGVVLAAGKGSRMGGPKALLVAGGEPLLRQHAQRMREAGCDEVVVVVPPVVEAQASAWLSGLATVIAAVTSSQAESLARAVAVNECQVLLVTPVDVMPARLETLERLFDALVEGVDAVTPLYRGHGGHPVVVRREVISSPAVPLSDRLNALGARRARVPVDDASVLEDFDTLKDLVGLSLASL